MDANVRRPGTPWRMAWPCWLLLLFACLAVTRLLPAGEGRAVVAAPILLSVPGALTLGALLAGRNLAGAWFGCLAALLSMVWAAFASLALYVLQVPITAKSTYWCLLLICAPLAAVAQARLIRGRPADAPEDSPRVQAGYALAAVVAGLALLAGATYGYLHVPHPAPVGYTWIAWSGHQVKGIIPVGGSGITMPFEIEHQQAGTAAFRLTAAWTGAGQRHSLARPVTMRIGPGKTLRGALAIPPPPGGCTYRIEVTMTELGQAQPQSWSINADVRHQGQRQNACGS